MQSEYLKGDGNNPEPFIIWKNARKEIKKSERIRKQSYQHPVTAKKQRKMTIEVSRPSSEIEDIPSFKSFESDRAIEEEQDKLENQYFISNINEEEENHQTQNQDDEKKYENQDPHESQGHYEQQDQQLHETDENIPFDCNEWELDKESPYLKNFNFMQDEMDELRIDA